MEKEIRTLTTEFRVVREGNNKTITGYAAVFNRDSENMGFVERIAPGAFKEALKRSDVRALWNHDANIILGRTKSGTLKLKEDKTGLHMEVDPPDTQLVRDMVMTPIERGDVTQQSFGFTVEKDEWADLDKDVPVRTITRMNQIYDVSPVVYPAYPDTEVALRSMEAAKQTEPPPMKLISEDAPVEVKIGELVRIYSGENRIDEAIRDLRSLSSSTRSDDENPDPAPKRLTEPDDPEVKDETLKRIDDLIEKFKE